MKITSKKLTCLVLALSLLVTASGAIASEQLVTSSALWESNFLALLAYAEENGLKLTDNPVFTVTEYPDQEGDVGYEHSLELADFMKVAYYDYGDDVFKSAVLTINLDHGGAMEEFATMAIYFTVLSYDTSTTWEESQELLEVLCPIFSDVFSGNERVNGAQAATMRGVGYGMEINDTERFIRLFTNATLTEND